MSFGCEICDWTIEFDKGGITAALKTCHEHYMTHSWFRRKWNTLLNFPSQLRFRRFQRQWTKGSDEGQCTLKK